MNEPREWGPNDTKADLAKPKAQINIVESDRKPICIEAANGQKVSPSHQHTGRRHGAEFARDIITSEIPPIIRQKIITDMSRKSVDTHNDARMLNDVIWPEQLRAHNPNPTPRQMTDHLA